MDLFIFSLCILELKFRCNRAPERSETSEFSADLVTATAITKKRAEMVIEKRTAIPIFISSRFFSVALKLSLRN